MTCREERCAVTMAGCNLPGMQTAREGVGSSGLEVLGCGLKCAKGCGAGRAASQISSAKMGVC